MSIIVAQAASPSVRQAAQEGAVTSARLPLALRHGSIRILEAAGAVARAQPPEAGVGVAASEGEAAEAVRRLVVELAPVAATVCLPAPILPLRKRIKFNPEVGTRLFFAMLLAIKMEAR